MQRFTIRWTGLPGGDAVNVLHSTGEAPGDAQTFADLITLALGQLAGGFMAPASAQVDEIVPTITPATGEATAYTSVDTAVVVGTGVNDFLPQNTMLLVRYLTSDVVAGRRVKGRTFLPGLGQGSSLAGAPTFATRTDVADAFQTLTNNNPDPTLAVYSRPVEGGRPGSSHIVTGVDVWQEWAQLGKRRS